MAPWWFQPHHPHHRYLQLISSPVPFCGTIKNGEVVRIECLDWTGGQIGNNDSADDVKNVDLTQVHYLSGPFEIETAEPGDVLIVEIQDVQPFQDQPWGFTGVFAKENGGGFLDEIYPNAYVFRSHDGLCH
jgi:formamidase